MIVRIYKITNLINGKIYVGQTTKTIEERFKKHSTTDSLIGKAIRKYGKENFKLELIAECTTIEEANKLEIYLIKEFNCKVPNGYNFTDGGEGRRGCTHSAESRKKLAISLKKFYKEHPEEREQLADLRKGTKDTEEVKIKKSEGMKKYYANHPEALLKHSEDMKKRYNDPLEREKTSIKSKEYWKKIREQENNSKD